MNGSASRIERLTAVMPEVTVALHQLVRDLDLSNDELMTALEYLTEVGQAGEFLLLSDVLGVSRIVDDQTHAAEVGTSSNVLGPFHVPGAPFIANPGTIADPSDPAPRITLVGQVTAPDGTAVADAVLDVWQADANGTYSNEDERLPEWNLRGRQRTGADGRYAIETVQPCHYTVKHDGPVGRLLLALGRHPWRPAHIHVAVEAASYRPLVTQVYVAGGPYLDDDAISGVKPELVEPVMNGRIEFDIVLSPAD